MCFTRVQRELNTIIIFVFQELKVRILRICRTRLLLYLAKKKSPAKSEPLKRSNRISIARNEISALCGVFPRVLSTHD